MTFDAEAVRLGGDGTGIAEPGDEHRHALLERHVDPALDLVGELLDLVAGRADGREEHVDAEWPVGRDRATRRISSRRYPGCRAPRR